MVVTLTLNPAIDKATAVDQLIPEKKLRCSEMTTEAGGGGINLSKAISILGGESRAIVPCGGVNGKLLLELLRKESVETIPIEITGNTRENIIVNETYTNKEYKFVVPGPSLDGNELIQIKSVISNLKDASFLVCSGSLPPGVPDDYLSEIAAIAKQKGIKFIVDTSGAPLQKTLSQGVFLIKPNMSELNFLAGTKYLEANEVEQAAEKIISQGQCQVIVISMGPSGAMLVTKDVKKRFPAPMVKKQSTVGAGDSMLAGIIWMLKKNESMEDAVRFGIACGTAASVNKGTCLFKKEDAFHFYKWIKHVAN